MKKRFWACFLSLSLVLTMMPTMAFAADDEVNEPGGTVEVCVETEGCTLEAGHEGECVVVESEPEEEEPESVPCTKNEGCTLQVGHEGECAVGSSVDSLSEDEIIIISITEKDMSFADKENPSIKSAIEHLNLKDLEAVTHLKVVTEGEAYLLPEDFYYLRDNIENLNYIDIGESTCKDNKIPDIAFCESLGTAENNWNPVGRPNLSTVILPQNITEVGKYAFYGSGLTELELPSTLKVIGNNAFGNCSNFSGTLSLPEGLITIDSNAFNKTPILGDLVIPDSVVTIGQNAFMNCGITGTLTIGKSVKTIGNNGFAGNLFAGDLVIPDSVETINNWVFSEGAFSEGEWTLGSSLIHLGDSALKGICSGNKGTLFIPAQLDARDTSFGYNTFSKVVFEEGTTAVSARVVRDSTSIEEVVLPSTIITIGTGAFSNCSSLSKVSIPDGVTTINSYAFQSTALSGVFVPATVKSIGLRAFEALPQNSVVYVENNDVYQLMIADHSDQWERRFDSNKTALAVTDGGIFAEDTEFTANTLVTPIKDGYIFEGWYTKNDTGDNWGTEARTITPGETYYAKWRQSDYSISSTSLDFGTVTYGSAAEAQITVSGDGGSGTLAAKSSDDDIFKAHVSGNNVIITSAENLDVGTYQETITITTPDSATFSVPVTITVTKATPSLTITSSATSLTGGGTVTLTVDKSNLPQNAVVSVSGYSNITDNSNGIYTVTLPNETADYTFTAKYDGDQNHDAADDTCTVYVTRHTGGGGASHPEASDDSSSDRNDRDDDDTENIDEEDVPLTEGKVADFDDVPADAWFAEAVQYVYEHDLMTGVSENLFAPNAQMNRAMVAQILFNVEKPADTEAPAAFRDVAPDAWYAEAVNWAVWQGYMSGYGAGSFGPNDALTREQLVTVLWRYSGSPVMGDSSMLNTFSDAAMTSDYAQQAMTWAYAQGVISGNADGTLNPQGTATRAEVATILMRFYENMAE